MPSKEEKRRRAKLVDAIAAKETAKAVAVMPISLKDLGALFDYLDKKMGECDCDHTPRMTKDFLENRKMNTDKILKWLQEYGGYCDCEVLANVEESWESEIEKYS